MKKCFIIRGGGQKVIQYTSAGLAVPYEVAENDWAERSGVVASDSYTGPLWAGSLERLQELADEWAGKAVELQEVEE